MFFCIFYNHLRVIHPVLSELSLKNLPIVLEKIPFLVCPANLYPCYKHLLPNAQQQKEASQFLLCKTSLFSILYDALFFISMKFMIEHPADQLNGILESIIGTVDTQVIVFRFSPFLTGVKFIVFFVLLIHVF